MDYNTEAFVSVPVFWVDGPLPACSAMRPPAACILSVKEQPGGDAHSLQTDLDRVWLNPASSCCFLPCRPDGRSFSPTSSSTSIFHSPPLTDTANQCAFCSRLEKFLSLCFTCSSVHLVYLLSQRFSPSHYLLSFSSTTGWRYLSRSADSRLRPLFTTFIPLFPVCLSIFLSLIRRMKTSVAHDCFLSHFAVFNLTSHVLFCVQNKGNFPEFLLILCFSCK